MKEFVKGYMGKELIVDLTAGKTEEIVLDEKTMRMYLGGSGYGVYRLYKEIREGVDPLSPENVLMFASGPLASPIVPGGGSVMICFKSPATGIWGQARCGGSFGYVMKRAGYDFITFKGRADRPVYVQIIQGKCEIKDASEIVGKDVYEKYDFLVNSIENSNEKNTSAMVIGTSGEKMVNIAGVMCKDRTAGRGGGGAVMGSKNLLGIVVSGDMKPQFHDEKKLIETIKNINKKVRASDFCEGAHEFGTVGDLPGNDEDGDLPTMNWRSNCNGTGRQIHDDFYDNYFIKSTPCYNGCPVACARRLKVDAGKYKTPEHEGSEYESVAAFTAFIMNNDADFASHCGYLCNKNGIDTISAGAIIAFAMECFEKGVITEKDTEGHRLEWGNNDAALWCLKAIIERKEGLGETLSYGVRKAAKILGGGSEKYAIHVKGLEGAAHDPRSGKMLGISYATGNRGMCHIQPFEGMAYDRGKMTWGMDKYGVRDPETLDRWDEKGKGTDCRVLQDGLCLPDILATCKFLMYADVTIDDWSDILNCMTGWDTDGWEILKSSERIFNLQRMFNVREGITRADDRLPDRCFEVPEFGTYSQTPECTISNFNALIDEYYEARGWNYNGIPKENKLDELGLTDVL